MVSAGAGAGKTRVLVSRMAELIMDEKNPVEADRFLVMTFTNAAAAEMKERISLDLEERLAKDPENHYLRKQIRKIRQADISTVHSFCNHLIRTHYNELSIDPSFRIGEEGELFLLRQQAIEQLLEEAYASGRESFVNRRHVVADHSFDEEETERGCRNDGNVRAAHGRFIGGNALLFALDCTLIASVS